MLAEAPLSYLEILDRVDDAIECNANIAESILECGLRAFGLPSEPDPNSLHDWTGRSKPEDAAKAHSTIRQFYRDWTKEGDIERQAVYRPVLQDLDEIFNTQDKSTIKVLVPGAGLGRLLYDLCHAGYTAEGNEISYHQLIASNWILNHTQIGQQLDLYPFVTQFTNNISRDNQFRHVFIPDIHPSANLAEAMQQGHQVGVMNMSAADFVVLYGSPDQAESFNAVATVFFIDTAPNLVRYIETIHNCLVSGGCWINIGPLLWHFDDRAPPDPSEPRTHGGQKDLEGIAEPGSFELTDDEVVILIERYGFRIEKREVIPEMVGYIQDPQSMLQNLYRTSHWVAIKQ